MGFELTILGCGSATPTTIHYPTAQVLKMAERFFLIDCGEGTQVQLRRYKVKFTKINHIFISHMHGDHFFGLFGLLSSFHLLTREKPIYLYGPPALEEIIKHTLGNAGSSLSYDLHFIPTSFEENKLLYEDEKVEVFSFPVKHSVPACGFLFKEKERPRNIHRASCDALGIPYYDFPKIKAGEDYTLPNGEVVENKALTTDPAPSRSYAFCTDTRPVKENQSLLTGVDLLYHETTFLEEDAEIALKTGHSTTKEAGEMANLLEAKKLAIGHFSPRYKSDQPFLKETRKYFKETVLAKEGLKIEVD